MEIMKLADAVCSCLNNFPLPPPHWLREYAFNVRVPNPLLPPPFTNSNQYKSYKCDFLFPSPDIASEGLDGENLTYLFLIWVPVAWRRVAHPFQVIRDALSSDWLSSKCQYRYVEKSSQLLRGPQKLVRGCVTLPLPAGTTSRNVRKAFVWTR